MLVSTSENKRFSGTIEKLCDVKVKEQIKWFKGILDVRYVNEGCWPHLQSLADQVMINFPTGLKMSSIGVWLMEPKQLHPWHTDLQPDNWIVRIHIPLITNPAVIFTMEDGDHHLDVGSSYLFNTLARHQIENGGNTVRAHVVMDICS
jgi:hypothetical protein